MIQQLEQRVNNVLSSSKVLELSSKFKGVDELYNVCEEYLGDVPKEEFLGMLVNMNGIPLEEHDLEDVYSAVISITNAQVEIK